VVKEVILIKEIRVRYVNRDHRRRLYGECGMVVIRAKGPGPKNILVRLDSGELVVAPWGNWRKAEDKQK